MGDVAGDGRLPDVRHWPGHDLDVGAARPSSPATAIRRPGEGTRHGRVVAIRLVKTGKLHLIAGARAIALPGAATLLLWWAGPHLDAAHPLADVATKAAGLDIFAIVDLVHPSLRLALHDPRDRF